MRRVRLGALLVPSLVLVGLALACQQPPPLSPPDTRAADERAIREAEDKAVRAVNTRDLEAVLASFMDDAVILPPNEPMVQGKEEIRKLLSQLTADPSFTHSVEPIKVQVSRAGDLAYLVGVVELRWNDPKGKPVTDRAKELEVWKKQPDGTWKHALSMFNSDLPAPGAGKH